MILPNNNWSTVLHDEFNSDYFSKIQAFLKEEQKNCNVFPKENDIFTALNLTDFNDVRVVIIGQDPYHEVNQAHGLAFSVNDGIKIPPSLRNIYKEIDRDLGIKPPVSGNLTRLALQGVLLLNATLTVREGCANSHKNIGWSTFTDSIIKTLNQHDTPIVFMLWGNNAKAKQKFITNTEHLVLTSSHPSPLSAHQGFLGCSHFSLANQFMSENGQKPIKW